MADHHFPSEPERAVDLLLGIFDAVGDGCHTLTVWVTGAARSFVSHLPFHNNGPATAVDQEQATDLMMLLALTVGRVGGVIVRTHYSGDTSRIVGWQVRDCTAVPLNRAQIFDACCTDPNGGPIPPEPGVEYADAPSVLA
ncbi:hypothetical protein AB0H07_46540 [Streptomyces sp. NPDC021354]|uniref:hypothetical protein n=1 Tax=Streptomyces sp. NPDC021354 TaxID=3154793 RepID=UPI0033E5C3B9